MITFHRNTEVPTTVTEVSPELVHPKVLAGFFSRGANINRIFAGEGRLYAYVSPSERYIRADGWDLG